jgi:hypothetical protein
VPDTETTSSRLSNTIGGKTSDHEAEAAKIGDAAHPINLRRERSPSVAKCVCRGRRKFLIGEINSLRMVSKAHECPSSPRQEYRPKNNAILTATVVLVGIF